MHYYATTNKIDVTHSDVIEGRLINLRFERHMDFGWAYAELNIPEFRLKREEGFNDHELFDIMEFAKVNSSHIWECARKKDRENMYELFASMSGTELMEQCDASNDPNEKVFYQELFQLKQRFPFVAEND